MRYKVALAAIPFLLFACGPAPVVHSLDEQNTVTVLWPSGQPLTTFYVEVVSAPLDLRRGLQGHAPLDEEHGMFFIFPKPESYSFWNKDVTFPIDILFADEAGVIVTIHENVPPCSSQDTEPCPTYSPYTPSQYVLELKGGMSATAHIEEGDILTSLHIKAPSPIALTPP